jgi:hypothetical protein
MSRLGPKDAKKNNNYFTNTEEVYDLIKMILTEIYSKEISDLGMDLLYNGASSILEIQSRLRLSFENIRNYLIIMLQNNLIQKKTLIRNEVKFISYELKFEQILNILLFPRTLNFIEKKYGDYGRMIFEQFINFGVLTLQQVVEQIQNDQKNGNNFDLVKAQVIEVFIKLYEDNLIMYSERVSEEENTYKPIINMSLLGNKDKLKKNKKSAQKEKETAKTEKRGKSNKKKKKEKESTKSKGIKLNESEDEEDEDERILNIVDKNRLNKNEEFYENNTKNNMHFYINFDQILAEFLSEIVIDYINSNISHQAALLSGFLLKKYKISAFVQGMTQPILIDEITNECKSISYNQIEEIIKNNSEIFIKSSSDDITLNINKLRKEIKSKTIQSLIVTKFSNEHFRVYNLLNLLGSLDGKNIMDLCLIGPKKVNSIINQLFQEGFIKTDSVENNGNCMLFYSVDEYQTDENILKMDFQIINNYKSYYNSQINNIKNKFRDIKKQNEDLVKLTYIIDQICENILIMKYF